MVIRSTLQRFLVQRGEIDEINVIAASDRGIIKRDLMIAPRRRPCLLSKREPFHLDLEEIQRVTAVSNVQDLQTHEGSPILNHREMHAIPINYAPVHDARARTLVVENFHAYIVRTT